MTTASRMRTRPSSAASFSTGPADCEIVTRFANGDSTRREEELKSLARPHGLFPSAMCCYHHVTKRDKNWTCYRSLDPRRLAGKFVVIVAGKLIGSGKQVVKLLERARSDYPREIPFVARIRDPKRLYILRLVTTFDGPGRRVTLSLP